MLTTLPTPMAPMVNPMDRAPQIVPPVSRIPSPAAAVQSIIDEIRPPTAQVAQAVAQNVPMPSTPPQPPMQLQGLAGFNCAGCDHVQFGADPAIGNTGWPTWAKVLLGLGVLGVVGTGIFLVTR